nr:retrovirus-related Pol polyprotein from transposon TNT 1-94 [Tanacetum cinerariifolium]
MVPAAVLTQSKPVSILTVKPVSVAVPKSKVTRPRHAKPIVTKTNTPTRRHITRIPSPKTSNSPPRVIVVKAPVGTFPIYLILRSSMVNMLPLEVTQRVVRFLEKENKDRTPSIGFMRPFGCPVTILNTLDSLGKFDGKVDEGFLVGYSVSSKAFRVFNSRTRIVQETLHVNFLENKPHVAGSGPTWLFDIDSLTRTTNYQPVTIGNQTNPSVGSQDKFDAEKAREEIDQQYVFFPVWSFGSTNPQNSDGDAAFDGKEPKFDEKKPESEVIISPSSSA